MSVLKKCILKHGSNHILVWDKSTPNKAKSSPSSSGSVAAGAACGSFVSSATAAAAAGLFEVPGVPAASSTSSAIKLEYTFGILGRIKILKGFSLQLIAQTKTTNFS